MNPLLKRILDNKRAEVAFAKSVAPEKEMKQRAGDSAPAREFVDSIHASGAPVKVIAEIKRISPGTGFCRSAFDPAEIAVGYERAGAAALSVLTDTIFFGGSLHCLSLARHVVKIPVLRKDFIIDPYQVHEARAAGADAVLVMAINFNGKAEMEDICGLALETGMDVLLEIHDEREMELIPKLDVCIGINNRDFRDEKLKVDIGTTRKLAPLLTGYRLLISESGIRNAGTMRELEGLGVNAFLVGSAFMETDDPGAALASFLEK